MLPLVLALLLDRFFAEPRRWHPLVGFGRWAAWCKKRCYLASRKAGLLAWLLAILPWVLLAGGLQISINFWDTSGWLLIVLQAIGLYLALGWKSLDQHLLSVDQALEQANLALARQRVGYLVSRDTSELDAAGVRRAALESLLENGNDAIFGAIFWYLLLGLPGVVFYRLANTLDALWGYRTPEYLYFGWAAARIDDLLNWLPARLTALSYSLLGLPRGHFLPSLQAAWKASRTWKSSNAGAVMAAGAVVLQTRLGEAAVYQGVTEIRPLLGLAVHPSPSSSSLQAGLRLLWQAVFVWLILIGLGGLLAC
ncbi:adenosylcobinamide-phosphate synthase CbiB [Marinospirillum perlucidum]|uniref:adenosylcobinamide-phosphate synthase CbiB n=1 Tax=Marinospirillum perlucidum TaxID=1982602 RepID=UPI001C49BB6E|nr:adenosylcobinamide-phosphate synthase CbiB [Marinospirillum perlucidum]